MGDEAVEVPPSTTQRFHIALLTDGDVTHEEIGNLLIAVGYRGLAIVSEEDIPNHECPCPSSLCITELKQHGHLIPPSTDCCICWTVGNAK